MKETLNFIKKVQTGVTNLHFSVALHAVTLLETVNTSASVHKLLLARKERMALGANFNLELTLDGTALEGLTASATNDALTVIGVDILLHRVILLYLLGAGRLAALLLHAGIYNPNEVIISYTAVPVQVLF